MKVIVTGSLGNISKPLAQSLIGKEHNVTVISSDENKKKDIEAMGATAAIGSLEDARFLTSVFRGADAVYAMVPPSFTAPDLREYYGRIGKSYATAIQQSGVRRVVCLSSMGAHLSEGTGPILGAHDVEATLDALENVAITYLRPSFFYTNFYPYINQIKGMGSMGSNYGKDDRLVMVSPKDIAAAAAEEIEMPSGKKVRYVASDEHTAGEAASILGSAIGKPGLQWIAFTDEQTQGGMEQSGMPAHVAAKFVEMGTAVRSGKLWEDYDLHKPAAMGKVKLEEFAQDFATAF